MITGIKFNLDDTHAEVTATSMSSGKSNTKVLKMTREQFRNWHVEGMLIQNAFPHLSVCEREFLMTGMIEGEYERITDIICDLCGEPEQDANPECPKCMVNHPDSMKGI